MTRLLVLCAGATLVAACSCADSHTREDAPSADAGMDALGDAVSDAPDSPDAPAVTRIDAGFLCDPTEPWARPCTEEARAMCGRWAAGLAGPGVLAHSTCIEGRALCWVGDDCPPVPPTLPAFCLCGSVSCRAGEVCVSDTPDGPRRCIEACAWLRDAG